MNRDQSVLPSLSGPILCASGCGFFGNPNTDNLCSKCNAERKQRNGHATATATATSTASPIPSPELTATSSPLPSTSTPATPTLTPLAISETAATSTALNTTTTLAPALITPSPAVATTATATTSASSPSPSDTPTPKKKLNRCGVCTKKVGITYFNCRCDDTLLLCSAHRLPHQHDCKFDLKKLHTQNLTKANPEIIRQKMEKI